MNLKIKYRESFRPFAPSVLRERVADYFNLDCDSPYMLLVAPVKESRRRDTDAQPGLWGIDLLNVPRSDIPAVTHLDYSARVQTVHNETNPRYYRLLQAFDPTQHMADGHPRAIDRMQCAGQDSAEEGQQASDGERPYSRIRTGPDNRPKADGKKHPADGPSKAPEPLGLESFVHDWPSF